MNNVIYYILLIYHRFLREGTLKLNVGQIRNSFPYMVGGSFLEITNIYNTWLVSQNELFITTKNSYCFSNIFLQNIKSFNTCKHALRWDFFKYIIKYSLNQKVRLVEFYNLLSKCKTAIFWDVAVWHIIEIELILP